MQIDRIVRIRLHRMSVGGPKRARECHAAMYFDPTYLIYMLPALLFGLWAQWRVSSAFNRYAQVPTSTGVTGAQTAEILMERTGHRFEVAQIPGKLTDYYDPSRKTMCLSQSSVQ
ncbi:MAG: zinc metallopeptidase, partial [Candidatus Eremiobacteraeota bacterium]|nr:zinc metallopeptidase [Candidatus Eremiobacteraeota bacterium]